MKRSVLIIVALGLLLFAQAAQADWSPAKRLTWTSADSFNPAIARDSQDAIHVVWDDSTPGNQEIYYRRSTDGGVTWNPVQRLTWTTGWSYRPAIAIDSSDVIHVVWDDGTPGNSAVYYKKSTNGGETWSAVKRLTWTSGNSLFLTIAVDSSEALHIAWIDSTPGNDEIYYKRSTDGGANWSAVKRLSWTSGNTWYPSVAADSGMAIYVAWTEYSPSDNEIHYRTSADRGETWGAVKRLTWTSGYSFNPDVAVDSSDATHVVWDDDTVGADEIYYRGSADGGASWSPMKRLTWTTGTSNYPAVAAGPSNTIHVVWHEAVMGSEEIYYKKSVDGGAAWGPATMLNWTSSWSYTPDLVIDAGSTVHVVWSDAKSGNYEIYYRKGN